MDNILKFIGSVAAALGGASVILGACSSYVAKFWADRIMKKKTAEYDKQLEFYKSTLELEREKYNAINEQIIHKNKKIFDNEFEIYKELSPKIINTVESFKEWIVDSKLSDEKYYEYSANHKDLKDVLSKYILFIDKDIYYKVEELLKYIAK
ncbi:MAG TPA: hypothetical protein DHW61_11930, partial [Lachnoclostridium phytofermentans]|nr:hypothetical protein [Lachnoclostridium phytofermentans]